MKTILNLNTETHDVTGFKVTNEQGTEQVHVTIIPKKGQLPLEYSEIGLPTTDAKVKETLRGVHFATAGIFELRKKFITQTVFGPSDPRNNCLVVIFERVK